MPTPMAQLRAAYRARVTKPSDVMAAALARLDAPDQHGVWISTVDPAAAMAAATRLDARHDEIDSLPLYGVVFSVKDNIDVAGEPTTAACPAFANTPTETAAVVQSAIDAGALYLGKTNLDQFATGLVGLRSPYGVARNPHNAAYIPGGSSSGAAVSVATGCVHFAFGTDTGGSGRVPACYSGITGLKPAPGALSRRGLVYACRSFDTASVFAAAPMDALAVFRAIEGHDPLDPFSTRPGNRRSWRAEAAPLGALRVATPAPGFLKFFGDGETAALFDGALGHLGGLVDAVEPFDFTPLDEIGQMMFFGPFVAERDVSVGAFIERCAEECDPIVRDLVLGSRRVPAADAYRAQYRVAEVRNGFRAFWDRVDAIVVPTVGALMTVEAVRADPLQRNFENGYYTNFANPLGLAAVATPFGRNSDGVPYGVTFLAPEGSEAFLCRLASAFSGGAAAIGS